MLEILKERHIFSTELSEEMDELVFREECDGFWALSLNKEQVQKLIQELQEVQLKMQ